MLRSQLVTIIKNSNRPPPRSRCISVPRPASFVLFLSSLSQRKRVLESIRIALNLKGYDFILFSLDMLKTLCRSYCLPVSTLWEQRELFCCHDQPIDTHSLVNYIIFTGCLKDCANLYWSFGAKFLRVGVEKLLQHSDLDVPSNFKGLSNEIRLRTAYLSSKTWLTYTG